MENSRAYGRLSGVYRSRTREVRVMLTCSQEVSPSEMFSGRKPGLDGLVNIGTAGFRDGQGVLMWTGPANVSLPRLGEAPTTGTLPSIAHTLSVPGHRPWGQHQPPRPHLAQLRTGPLSTLQVPSPALSVMSGLPRTQGPAPPRPCVIKTTRNCSERQILGKPAFHAPRGTPAIQTW